MDLIKHSRLLEQNRTIHRSTTSQTCGGHMLSSEKSEYDQEIPKSHNANLPMAP